MVDRLSTNSFSMRLAMASDKGVRFRAARARIAVKEPIGSNTIRAGLVESQRCRWLRLLITRLQDEEEQAICAPKPNYAIGAEFKPILEPCMVSWLAKAIVQRAIGALPNPHYWNGLLQQRYTQSLELSAERFEQSLANCRDHLLRMRWFGSGTTGRDFTAFELGTGWFPTVALGFFLCGARDVWTWDVVPFVNRDRLKATVRKFLEFEQEQRLSQLPVLPERLVRLRAALTLLEQPELPDPEEVLEQLGVHYRIGGAGRSDLPAQCVDLVASDVVLEYLSPCQLSELLQEMQRIGGPNVVMSHSIDLKDQYSAYDPSITPFNFLRFSDLAWRCINNPIIPLNRLRVNDYRRAFGENGFQVVEESNESGNPADLARTPLAARFRGYALEDLLVIHTRLVAIRAPS